MGTEKSQNVPKLRFDGFVGAWEQRKLGNIISTYPFKDYIASVEDSGEYDVIQQGDIPIVGKSNKEPFLKYQEVVLFGDHTLSLYRPSSSFLISTDGIKILGNHYQLPQKFFYYMLERYKPMSEGYKRHFTILVNKDASYPKGREEQSKIGSLVDKLDSLITLHQRKLSKLRDLKKALLVKMFPADGENVPAVRFKEFTDDWAQRKLPDLVEFFSGLTYTPNDVQETGTLVLRSSNVFDGEIVDADNVYVDSKIVNVENVKVGDVVVVVRNGSRSLIGKHAQIKKDMPDTVIGAFMTGIRSQQSQFINALLNTDQFDKNIAANMGATINQITGYMFSNMKFKVPAPVEQKKIGKCFERLDGLISLHQRKLSKLKDIKKALLNNMFPGGDI